MGADGHITIWRSNEVRKVWPDADTLFQHFWNHYKHSLSGVEYDHLYHGDNMSADWRYEEDWLLPHPQEGHWIGQRRESLSSEQRLENEAVAVRLREFVRWLEENGTAWEVWT